MEDRENALTSYHNIRNQNLTILIKTFSVEQYFHIRRQVQKIPIDLICWHQFRQYPILVNKKNAFNWIVIHALKIYMQTFIAFKLFGRNKILFFRTNRGQQTLKSWIMQSVLLNEAGQIKVGDDVACKYENVFLILQGKKW